MELQNYEERFWWKKIYHASIKAGVTPHQAHLAANCAVVNLRETPVVVRSNPNQ